MKSLTTFINLYLLTSFCWLGWIENERFVSLAYRSWTTKENCLEIDFPCRLQFFLFLFVMLHESCDNSPPGAEHFRKVPASLQIHGWSGLVSPSISLLCTIHQCLFWPSVLLFDLAHQPWGTTIVWRYVPKHVLYIPENTPLFCSCLPFHAFLPYYFAWLLSVWV